jgi:hypothetical protein
MNAQAVTYALLSADAGVTAMVPAARIYPSILDEGQPLPAVVFFLVSTVDMQTIDSAAYQLRRSRVQVNALAQDYAQAQQLARAIGDALSFQRGSIAGVTVASIVREWVHADDFDTDLHAHLVASDFLIVWHET